MSACVLLHGFLGGPRSWDRVRAQLPKQVRVHAPWLMGHGPSDWSCCDRDFEGEVDRLADWIGASVVGSAVGARKVYGVGYSMGARVLLGLLARHPQLFQGALLVGGHPGVLSGEERVSRKALEQRWVHTIESSGLEAFVNGWEQLPLFESQLGLKSEVLAQQRALRLSHDPRGIVQAIRVLGRGAMPGYWDALPEIDLPVRWVVGSQDTAFRTVAGRACAMMPRARVFEVPGGHNVVLETPDVLANLIVEGLEHG